MRRATNPTKHPRNNATSITIPPPYTENPNGGRSRHSALLAFLIRNVFVQQKKNIHYRV